MNSQQKVFVSFRQFWPFYLSQHNNKKNRVLHSIGLLMAICIAAFIVFLRLNLYLLFLCPVVAYGFAWSGHFLIEKNMPATFTNPIYSLMGDIHMVFRFLLGRNLRSHATDKLIFISGASRGLGFGMVQHFLEQGYHVVAAVRSNNDNLFALSSKFGSRLVVLIMDVTSCEQVAEAAKKVRGMLGDKELILINNAGISGGGPFELMSSQHWVDMLAVNVIGLASVTKELFPMIREAGGKVVNIGSLSGRIASRYLSSYAASKFAVRGLTDGLRREFRRFNIPVVLLEPGPIDTDIWSTSLINSSRMLEAGSPEVLEVYSQDIQNLRNEIENIKTSTVSVEYVVAYVDEAVNSAKPKPYYWVGKNAGIIFLITHFLPTIILDRILGGGRFEK